MLGYVFLLFPRILYATGEEEDLDLEEIIRDGHIRLLPL